MEGSPSNPAGPLTQASPGERRVQAVKSRALQRLTVEVGRVMGG
jgi:hypothetical protein